MALKGLLNSACTIVFGSYGGCWKDGKACDCGPVQNGKLQKCSGGFQMPLHYPRYKREDYEKMEEWKVDMLLQEYGLHFPGSLEEKREFAIGAFVWPHLDDSNLN